MNRPQIQWPADAVERRSVNDLIPRAGNPRAHPDWQIAQIARSIEEWGWTIPILVDEAGEVIAGHGRIMAALKLELAEVPVMVARNWTEAQKRAYVIADNQLALNATWDRGMLSAEVLELKLGDFDLSLLAIKNVDLLLPKGSDDSDDIPDPPAVPRTQRGDVWLLGSHRLMCGDSTDSADVARLMNGQTAQLIHADPPYGMGKEAVGIANDNQYGDDLDEFQMAWWSAVRPFAASNGSAYIWGNADNLWRLWHVGGLGDSEVLELRNEIVWDKSSIAGMASPDLTQFPVASERCLFFQFGTQFMAGNVNTDAFPDAWEPLRSYMEAEALAVGLQPKDIKRICGCGMYAHWFSRSQFTLIPKRHYAALALAYPGHFERPWMDLRLEWQRVRGRSGLALGRREGRSYFDNAHTIMHDVWQFDRVHGDERFGIATPKPVAMIERILRSSLIETAICLEPFAGTGTTVVAAERSNRICYAMELEPAYVDTAVTRWETLTGQRAVRCSLPAGTLGG